MRLTTRPSSIQSLGILALLALFLPFFATPSLARLNAEEAEQYYRQGQDALAEGRYSDAVDRFRALSQEDGAQVDRAVYWQAYAQAKAGQKRAALSTLERLGKDFPDSAWLDDARALEVELGGVSAERAAESGNEDLKLYALDALMHAEPERAVDLLEKFLAGDHSVQLKQHALFVLGQTDSPRATQILSKLARGEASTGGALQRQAIQALGVSDEPAAVAVLAEIYRQSNDRETKRTILNAMVASDAAKVTADLALADDDPELRREAIRMLGAMDATAEIERVAASVGPKYRHAVFEAYGIAGDATPLLQVVRQSQDPDEIEDAIDALVIVGSTDAVRTAMIDLYHSSTERRVQEKVLSFLMIEDESGALLEIFRAETDPELKRQALRQLSLIDDEDAMALIEDLLEN